MLLFSVPGLKAHRTYGCGGTGLSNAKEYPHSYFFLHSFMGRVKTQVTHYCHKQGYEAKMQLPRYMNKNQISVQVLDDIEAPLCEKVIASYLLPS